MVQQVDQPANRYVDVWATMINNEVRLRDGWVPPMGVAVLRFPFGHPYRGNLSQGSARLRRRRWPEAVHRMC